MNRRQPLRALIFALPFLAIACAPWAQAQTAGDTAEKMLKAASPLGDRILGQSEAPVVVVEYASATCPHCAEFHANVLPAIKTEYIDSGKVRFIFREFPLDQVALGAFMLARCVPQDKYFATIDLMFRRQSTWMKGDKAAELFKVTQMAGMDKAGFDACLARGDIAKAMVDFARQASKDFGIKGTPAVFVNGQMIEGHKEMPEMKAAIDAALNK